MGISLSAKKLPPKSIVITGITTVILVIVASASLILYRNSMMEHHRQTARDMVESAYRVIEFYHAKIEKEGMPEEDAKEFIFQTIRKLPFDSEGYCWINDMQGTVLMHPAFPSLNGENLYGFHDVNGVQLMRDFIEMVKNHDFGFVFYAWPKPGAPSDEWYAKISYVKGFKPWGWVIASGIYIDDVGAAFWRAALISGLLSLSIIAFVIALSLTFLENAKKADDTPS